MLCPDCRIPVAGGSVCPQCGEVAPARETFSGQGGHYLRLLLLMGITTSSLFFLLFSLHSGFSGALHSLVSARWSWLYLAFLGIPLIIALYTWRRLREEEITVTDEYIARRSHWGNEHLLWKEITAFEQVPTFLRHTRLGRMVWLSRVFSREKLLWHLPPIAYELVGTADANGD